MMLGYGGAGDIIRSILKAYRGVNAGEKGIW